MENNDINRRAAGRDEKSGDCCGAGSCHPRAGTGSYRDNKVKLLHGLRRVEGQVRGIQRMVEEERYCVDVLNQIAAARTALVRLALIILEDHTGGCVSRAVAGGERKKEIRSKTVVEVCQFASRSVIAPRIDTSLWPSRCVLPLRLHRQPAPHPGAE